MTRCGSLAARKHARTIVAALQLQWRAIGYWSIAQIAVTVLGGCLPAVSALAMRGLIDHLARPGDHVRGDRLILLVGAVGMTGVATLILSQTGNLLASMARYRIAVVSARRLYERVMSFSGLGYFENPSFRDKLFLAEQAAQTAPSTLSNAFQQTLQAVVVIFSFAGMLLLIWPPIVFVLGGITIPSALAQTLRAKKYASANQALAPVNRMGAVYRSLLVDVAAAKEARIFGFGGLLVDRYTRALEEAGTRFLALERRTAAIQVGLTIITSSCVSFGLWVVVRGVADGTFTIGDVTFFLAAAAAVQGGLSSIVSRVSELAIMLRLFPIYVDITSAPDDLRSGSRRLHRLRDSITFRDVWFRYGPKSEWIIRGLDLTIAQGTSVGLVGLNGAGKSTLVKLLCRFYDPERGAITWDGVDIREYQPRELRERIGAIFQDYVIYELTAAENIGLGAIDHIDDRVLIERAAAAANIESVLADLPRGYDTLLSRSFFDADRGVGVHLSGGQGQRLAFARALMSEDTDVLILDEPNAGLDPWAEHSMRASAASWSAGRTTLLVSHRLGAIRRADEIVVIENGRVTERGTHDELISFNGTYRRLFNYQADAYREDGLLARAPGKE